MEPPTSQSQVPGVVPGPGPPPQTHPLLRPQRGARTDLRLPRSQQGTHGHSWPPEELLESRGCRTGKGRSSLPLAGPTGSAPTGRVACRSRSQTRCGVPPSAHPHLDTLRGHCLSQ